MMTLDKIWEFDSNIIKLNGNDLTVYSTMSFNEFKERFCSFLNQKSYNNALKTLKKLFKRAKVTHKTLDADVRDLFLELFLEIEKTRN